MPTLAESPSLTRRLEDAVAAVFGAVAGLAGLPIKAGISDGEIATPYMVINASRSGERIHASGVYDFDVTAILKTTAGDGPKATDDATLLAYDAAMEEALFGPSVQGLAAAITAAGEYLRCDAVMSPGSEPTAFDDTRREITYSFSAVCLALPES